MSNFKVPICVTSISETECSPEDLNGRTALRFTLFRCIFILEGSVILCDFCDGSKDICVNYLTNLHM